MAGKRASKRSPIKDPGSFNVAEIRDISFENGFVAYLVHWEKCSDEEDTWEPVENLDNCAIVLTEFWDERFPESSSVPAELEEERKRIESLRTALKQAAKAGPSTAAAKKKPSKKLEVLLWNPHFKANGSTAGEPGKASGSGQVVPPSANGGPTNVLDTNSAIPDNGGGIKVRTVQAKAAATTGPRPILPKPAKGAAQRVARGPPVLQRISNAKRRVKPTGAEPGNPSKRVKQDPKSLLAWAMKLAKDDDGFRIVQAKNANGERDPEAEHVWECETCQFTRPLDKRTRMQDHVRSVHGPDQPCLYAKYGCRGKYKQKRLVSHGKTCRYAKFAGEDEGGNESEDKEENLAEEEEEESSEEEEEVSSQEEENEDEHVEESGLQTPAEGSPTPSGSYSVPAGLETPDMIELPEKRIEQDVERLALYTVPVEKRLDRNCGAMMASVLEEKEEEVKDEKLTKPTRKYMVGRRRVKCVLKRV